MTESYPFDLSLIVPSYNEEGNVEEFFEKAVSVFESAGISYELVFVDDGSADDTLRSLKRLLSQAPQRQKLGSMQVISFSRNFGKESALLAGMKKARGRCLGFIDADLQQRPETALRMFEYLEQDSDCDCVTAVQVQRKESFALRAFKKMFYLLFNRVSDTEIPADASDFRVFRRNVADALMGMPEYFRFSKGLFSWVGFHTHIITYHADQRFSGKSAWNFRSLMKYALGGLASFSTWPLKLALILGLITSFAAVVYLIVVILEYLVAGIAVPGYPTIVCLLLLLGGVALLVLGVIGEYIGRIYIEGKGRPLYITREEYVSSPKTGGDSL